MATSPARVIWEREVGSIPHGMIVHHVDHNRTNNVLSNFVLMTPSNHIQHHQLSKTPWLWTQRQVWSLLVAHKCLARPQRPNLVTWQNTGIAVWEGEGYET